MKTRSTALAALLLAALGAAPMARAADYVIAVEPSYPPDQAEAVYAPLLAYLGRATGHRFTLRTSPNYHVYWRDMRAVDARPHFTLEEAHFVDYRVRHQGAEPLARLNEPSGYALLADAATAERGLEGLVGYRVTALPAPSLGNVLLDELYRNPVAQPQIQSTASTWRDGVEMIFSGETEAAMVPLRIAQLYPNLVEVARTREFPGDAVVASLEVPAEDRAKVREALLAMHEDPDTLAAFAELGATRFVATTAAEYAGAERMLAKTFGYTPPRAPAGPAAPAASAGRDR